MGVYNMRWSHEGGTLVALIENAMRYLAAMPTPGISGPEHEFRSESMV